MKYVKVFNVTELGLVLISSRKSNMASIPQGVKLGRTDCFHFFHTFAMKVLAHVLIMVPIYLLVTCFTFSVGSTISSKLCT